MTDTKSRRAIRRLPPLLLCAGLAGLLSACGGGGYSSGGGQGCGGYNQQSCGGGYGGGNGGQYIATALVTDTGSGALHADARLVNSWGMVIGPSGYAWVANARTGYATSYDGNGVAQPSPVQLPGDGVGPASPTGIVENATGSFVISIGNRRGTPELIFATLQGRICAWSPDADATHAFDIVDRGSEGAAYTGLAIGTDSSGHAHLYAADFGLGRVEVYDGNYLDVTPAGAFADPGLPADYVPFGIQAVGNRILVAFAQVDAATGAEVHAPGAGAVDVFDMDGHLEDVLVAPGGALNAPWGIALAPANFGPLSNRLVVSNFGDGTLSAFDAQTGAPAGVVKNDDGSTLVIDGLWGIAFGNGLFSQPTHTLFYAAAPGRALHGEYGRIDLN